MLNAPTFKSWESQEKKNNNNKQTKRKGMRKYLRSYYLKTSPKWGRKWPLKSKKTQRVPNRINPMQNTPRHILIKLSKIKHKEKILNAAREKQQITHKGIHIRIIADLSMETLQATRELQDILKVMKEKNLQPRLLYSARISFKYEGDFKALQTSKS